MADQLSTDDELSLAAIEIALTIRLLAIGSLNTDALREDAITLLGSALHRIESEHSVCIRPSDVLTSPQEWARKLVETEVRVA